MHWQFRLILIPLFAAAVICGVLVVFAWRRRTGRGAIPFTVLMGAVTFWTLSYVLELSGGTLPVKLLGLQLSFIGVVIGPAALIIFSLMYTNRGEWIRWPRWLLFALVPLLTLGPAARRGCSGRPRTCWRSSSPSTPARRRCP